MISTREDLAGARRWVVKIGSALLTADGRGLDRDKADQFVGMYVNELTLQYGERGREAVNRLFQDAWDHQLIPRKIDIEFSV